MTRGGTIYAGDIDPQEAFQRLGGESEAQLVDVRTPAEWDTAGVPDLSAIGKEPILIEWKVPFSIFGPAGFLARLSGALSERGLGRDAPLYFLCRSGARSAAAAEVASAAGQGRSFNVVEGFEGFPDDRDDAGAPAGWKARGLPWTHVNP